VCSSSSVLYSVVYPLDVCVFGDGAGFCETVLSCCCFFLVIQRQDPDSGRDEGEEFEGAGRARPVAPVYLEAGWCLGVVQGVHGYDGEHVLNAYVRFPTLP